MSSIEQLLWHPVCDAHQVQDEPFPVSCQHFSGIEYFLGSDRGLAGCHPNTWFRGPCRDPRQYSIDGLREGLYPNRQAG